MQKHAALGQQRRTTAGRVYKLWQIPRTAPHISPETLRGANILKQQFREKWTKVQPQNDTFESIC